MKKKWYCFEINYGGLFSTEENYFVLEALNVLADNGITPDNIKLNPGRHPKEAKIYYFHTSVINY